MATMVRGSFSDLMDPRFREVATDEFQKYTEDYIPHLFGMPGATSPQRDTERYSEISGLPTAGIFTGTLDYAQFFQGYDTTASYVEFAQALQLERTLIEYDQHNVIDDRIRALTRSMYRRRQGDALRWLRNGFSVDTFFHNRSEGVALFSNSHTTTTGASTTAGFDNLTTSSFSATALAAMQIQAHDLRDLQGEPIEVVIDLIAAPIDLYEQVWETVSSMGKVDTANNNRNVHYGAYDMIFFRNKVDFTDVNDWFGFDKTLLKSLVLWFDQVYPGGAPEFGTIEDFDTFASKHRAYMRYTNVVRDWRFGIGSQVS